MKILNLMFLGFLVTGGAAAQTPSGHSNAPDIVVIKNGWRTRVLDSAINEDPLRPSRDRVVEETAQKQITEEYKGTGVSTTRLPSQDVKWRTLRVPMRSVQYIFEVEIKNTGAKRMREVVWEYVFLDSVGGREVGYRLFTSKINVSPGNSAKMVGYMTLRVNSAAEAKEVNKAAQEAHRKYLEQISVRRIEYDDNSVWERPSK